jgi:hypothetical protein
MASPTPYQIKEALKAAGITNQVQMWKQLGIPKWTCWAFSEGIDPPSVYPSGLARYHDNRDRAYCKLGLLKEEQ